MHNDRMVSKRGAEVIGRYIERDNCKIDDSGHITGRLTLYTRVLEVWLKDFDAHFYIDDGQPTISNWVPPEPKPLPPGEYTCKVTANKRYNDPTVAVEAVITEGEYKGRTIPIKLQSEDC